MKKFVIIIFSLIAIASLLLLVSRQPSPAVKELNPVKIISDTLVTPAQPVVALDTSFRIIGKQ